MHGALHTLAQPIMAVEQARAIGDLITHVLLEEVDLRILEHQPGIAPQCLDIQRRIGDGIRANAYIAALRTVQPVEVLQQGGLAGTGGAS